ncbi:hypothetical protein VSR82_37945 [Burkholderia sp. JPY481]
MSVDDRRNVIRALRHLRNSTPASLSASCYDTAISVKGSSQSAVPLSGSLEEHVRLQKVLGSATSGLSAQHFEGPFRDAFGALAADVRYEKRAHRRSTMAEYAFQRRERPRQVGDCQSEMQCYNILTAACCRAYG